MFLHLPIAILATLSSITVSDAVPKFDIVRECSYEGGTTTDAVRGSRDESAALRQLQQTWAQYAGAERKACTAESTIGGFASYVELLTCLEMAGLGKTADNGSRGPLENPELRGDAARIPEPTVDFSKLTQPHSGEWVGLLRSDVLAIALGTAATGATHGLLMQSTGHIHRRQ
jgi:hypothetical protein